MKIIEYIALSVSRRGAARVGSAQDTKQATLVQRGFTIVELLIIIVVIAILAAITIVAYNGVQTRAEESKLQSDLNQASRILGMDFVDNSDQYPATAADAVGADGLSPSAGTRFEYTSDGESYCLSATSEDRAVRGFHISSTGGNVQEGVCDGHQGPSVGGGSSEPIASTPAECFEFNIHGTIIGYDIDCSRDVVIPAEISGVAVTSIANRAFHDNLLTSVTIPDSVTSIGRSAFRLNDLTSVTIPGSVTRIEEDAFRGNQLTSVTFPDSVTRIWARAFHDNPLQNVSLKSGTQLGTDAFPAGTEIEYRQ